MLRLAVGGHEMPKPKKLEDIVMALKRENPKWAKSRIYATAWSTYNKMKK